MELQHCFLNFEFYTNPITDLYGSGVKHSAKIKQVRDVKKQCCQNVTS